MMATGVVVAMRWEAESLASTAVRFDVAGTGPARARAAAHRLVQSGATALVSWGVAAGLDPRLAPGSVVLPATVLGADGIRYPVDVEWRARAASALAGLRPSADVLAETPCVLDCAAAKVALRQRTGAAAADMESAAVLQVAAQAALPGLVIRVVLDPAASGVARAWAETIGSTGRLQPTRLAATLARPRLWASGLELARFRNDARHSLRSAAAGLEV